MENRDLIVKELYSLRILLNTANLLKNSKTDIDFEIRKSKNKLILVCFVKSPSNKAFIVLAQKTGKLLWRPSSSSAFPNLSKFFIREMNTAQKLTEFEFQLIKKNLRSLGIK